MKIKKSMNCNVCCKTDVEFWAMLPDIYGVKYLCPLRDARYCPGCGKPLKGESNGSAAD